MNSIKTLIYAGNFLQLHPISQIGPKIDERSSFLARLDRNNQSESFAGAF